MDVFCGAAPWYEKAGGLLVHLFPVYILIGALVISWKREATGGIMFILISLFFTYFFHSYKSIVPFLLISFPLIVIGSLFLLGAKAKDRSIPGAGEKRERA